ncbi:hypothetical protein [Occultella kanbiaonis]|uniref:hypothetical protein n=1 Tax=Occultella kanbiaonis TaxID=2675754 RepID=UPI0012B70011|nr:hypothetical protein [Occultella kanbiaonis]
MRLVMMGGGAMTALAAHEADLDPVAARRLTDQLRVALEGGWQLAIRAWAGRVWVALGYASWDEYCTRELGQCRIRLPRQDREEVLAPLSAAGMSTRAIGSLTGLHATTVQRVLADADVSPGEAEADAVPVARRGGAGPRRVAGRDGKQYPSKHPTRSDVLVRRAEVARLRNLGFSQVRIAAELGVAQATVSADLAELTAISGAAGVAGLTEVLQEARDEAGRTDVAAVAEYLGVQTSPGRDLGRLSKQPVSDLHGTLSVLLEEVVYSDEWLDDVQHEAAVAVLLPGVALVVAQLARILGALTEADRAGPAWEDLRQAIGPLLAWVEPGGGPEAGS